MTDYSLWEVILNGDSPVPTRVIEGVVHLVAPTTTEQKLARKNELKARGTLLMALPVKHQLKFNTHKDAKTLMEEIKKRFGGNTKTLLKQQYENFTGSSFESLDQIHDKLLPTKWRTHTLIRRNKTDLEEQSLDDLFNSLKIYEAEVKSSSTSSTSTQNIAFVSSSNTDSTNEPVSAAASVSAVSAKIPVSVLPNIDADDLEEMDLKWQIAMLTIRARRFLQRTGRNLREMDLLPCDLICLRWSVTTATGNDTLQGSVGLLRIQEGMVYDWSFQADEEPTNYALMAFSFSSSSSDNESDESLPPSPIYDRYQSGNGYHAVPPPYTRTFMPPKPDLVFHNAPTDVETVHTTFNVELSPTKPDQDLSPTTRPLALIIEDLVSDSEDESETQIPQNVPSFVQPTEQVKFSRPSVKHVETSIPTATSKTAILNPTSNGKCRNRKACFVCKILTLSKLVPITDVRPVTTIVPKPTVTRPRQAKTIVTKPNSPPRRHISHSPSPKATTFPPKVTAVKTPMDKGVIDSGCSRHMTGNMSYLSDFEELNGRYVAFGGNPKGGKISGKGKIRTGKLDFDDVYFVKELKFNLFSISQIVPRENNMYNVDLKNIVPSGDLTCLFAKATLDESNLWHRRLGNINFKTMNKLVKGNLVRGLPSNVFENDHTCVACKKGKQHRAFCKTKHNTNRDAAFNEKEPEFERRKPESEVNVSPSSKFEDFFDNSINEDNAAGTLVPAVGQLSTNCTNTFSVAGPSCINTSQYPDDPNMPELEDITYSDNEDDVGAEVNFNNLETSITGRMIVDMDADVDVTLKDVAAVAKDVKDAEMEESADVQGRQAESQAQIYQNDLEHADKVLITTASATITVAASQLTTAAAPTLTTAPSAARKRKGVVIRDPEETATPSVIIHSKAKSKDKGKGIMKLDEEVEELKRRLQIVPNDEDDVYTEATPLALKVPVVDYEIYTKNNKPYYKIKRADGSHQLYLSFLSMLRNFNREDFVVLWRFVKEQFASIKPKNFSDDFLLTTLGAMFEKPDIQA
nr:hypothetical protein [Tanacetum cinerariifolium]